MFAVLSWLAGVGLGWLTALAGSVKIINWLTIPTAVANITNSVGGLFFPVNFYAVLDITRLIGVGVIAVSLPLLWWRFRHTDRQALTGIAWAMAVVVLFVPAALPWYYTWPLAVMSSLAQSRGWIAAIAGFSTWIMVIFKPDGSHGMYSWIHVLLATACALAAWYSLYRPDRFPSGSRRQSTRRQAASVSHGLGPADHLAGLMGVQGIDRAGVLGALARAVERQRQRRICGEQPAQDLGVAVAAVAHHGQQADSGLTTVPASVNKAFGTTTVPFAAHGHQMAVAQLLMHFGDRDPEHLGHFRQVDRPVRRRRVRRLRPECCSPNQFRANSGPIPTA